MDIRGTRSIADIRIRESVRENLNQTTNPQTQNPLQTQPTTILTSRLMKRADSEGVKG
jgi:hypothetical protein